MHICDLLVTGNLEDLIRHGLHTLRETLQQDKELTTNNTSIDILGPGFRCHLYERVGACLHA